MFKKLLLAFLIVSLLFTPVFAGGNRWTSKPPLSSQIDWSHPLSRGLIGAWLMNEGGGLTVKNIVNNNVGIISNTSTLWVPSQKGTSLRFTGADGNNIDIGTTPDVYGNLTFICWIKTFAVSGPKHLYGSYLASGAYTGWGVAMGETTSGSIAFWSSAEGSWRRATSTNYNSGYWIQIAITLQGTTLQFYKNAIYDGNGGQAVNPPPSYTGTKRIAARSDSAQGIDADIANVLIYSRALSPQEIQQLYIEPYCFIKPPTIWSNFTTAVAGATSNVFGWMSGNATQDIFGISD